MSKIIPRLLAAGMMLAPLGAAAAPITIDFTVSSTYTLEEADEIVFTWDGYAGYPWGTVGTGSLTFDDSVGNYSWNPVTPGFTPLDFEFNWLGLTFTEADTVVWQLLFDENGQLALWSVGALPCSPSCISTTGPTDFAVSGSTPIYANNSAFLHREDAPGIAYGTTTSWSVRTASVPEPASLGLFALGLAGVAAARRRRTK